MPIFLFSLALQQPPATPATAAPVARIVVTPSQPTVTVGDSVLLVGRAVDANGAPTEARILYNQGGYSFEGKVDRSGWVKAGAPGTVVATVSAVQAGRAPVVQRVEVKVVAGAPTRVAIAPMITALVAGQTYPLTASGISRDGDQVLTPATWKSANPLVARVSAEGVVTAVAAGRTTLTAMVGGVTTTMPVEVVSAAAGRSSLTASAGRVR